MPKLGWVWSMVAFLSLLCAVSAVGQRLVVDRTLHDFGPVRDGDVVQCVFLLSNTGPTAIAIGSVSYNCSCTSYTFLLADGRTQGAPYILPVGQDVKMQVAFRTRGYARFPQPVSQVLTISSNDLTRRSFQVTIQATVLTTLPFYLSSAPSFGAAHFFLIDLRSPEDYAAGRLFGAINIPFEELDARLSQLPPGRTYILYDYDGRQAEQAVSMMRSRGEPGATFVSGGLVRWHADLGDQYIEWAEGIDPLAFLGSTVGGAYSQAPSAVAGRYLVVVDLSAPEEFARAHVPGSVHLSEDQVIPWAEGLIQQLSLGSRSAITIWILDDVRGAAAYRAAQRLATAGFNAISVQGGRTALQEATGDQLLWVFAGGD